MVDFKETISISRFKATCLAVLERVRTTGVPVLITKRGEPIAQVLPPPPPVPEDDWLGSMRGRGEIVGDIVSPVGPPDEWDVFKP